MTSATDVTVFPLLNLNIVFLSDVSVEHLGSPGRKLPSALTSGTAADTGLGGTVADVLEYSMSNRNFLSLDKVLHCRCTDAAADTKTSYVNRKSETAFRIKDFELQPSEAV